MKIKLENVTDEQNRVNFFGVVMTEGTTEEYVAMTTYIEDRSEFECVKCPDEWDEDFMLSDSFACDRGHYGPKKEAASFLRKLIRDFKKSLK